MELHVYIAGKYPSCWMACKEDSQISNFSAEEADSLKLSGVQELKIQCLHNSLVRQFWIGCGKMIVQTDV